MANPQAEPSMDEILASIRRIIAEEDEPQGASQPVRQQLEAGDLAGETAAPEETAEVEAPQTDEDFDTVFDQMEAEGQDEVESVIEAVEIVTQEVEQEIEEPEVVELSRPVDTLEADVRSAFGNIGRQEGRNTMLNDTTVAATSTAFEALQENIRITDTNGKTLEDVVERMLQPLLKQWLDQNLTRIVEEKVEEEVRRIARRR